MLGVFSRSHEAITSVPPLQIMTAIPTPRKCLCTTQDGSRSSDWANLGRRLREAPRFNKFGRHSVLHTSSFYVRPTGHLSHSQMKPLAAFGPLAEGTTSDGPDHANKNEVQSVEVTTACHLLVAIAIGQSNILPCDAGDIVRVGAMENLKKNPAGQVPKLPQTFSKEIVDGNWATVPDEPKKMYAVVDGQWGIVLVEDMHKKKKTPARVAARRQVPVAERATTTWKRSPCGSMQLIDGQFATVPPTATKWSMKVVDGALATILPHDHK